MTSVLHPTTADAVPATPRPPLAAARASRRDLRLDLLRGLCLISMVCGHLAQGRWIDVGTHPFRVVDGAAGFVVLSGVVLGRVQRRRPNLLGPLRRARTLWCVHVAMLIAAFTLKAITGRPDFLPTVASLGGSARTAFAVATLQVQPDWFTVLPFYVVALAAAPIVIASLRRGWTHPVVFGSLFVYGMSQHGTWNTATVFEGTGAWDWGGWQVLFVLGLVAGWHWQAIADWASSVNVRRRVLGVGALATAVAFVVGHFVAEPETSMAFNKFQVGLGVPLAVALLAAPAYWLAGRVPHKLAAPLARLGSNSLEGYVAMACVQLLIFSFWLGRPIAFSIACIAAVIAYTFVRAKKTASAPATAPAVVEEDLVLDRPVAVPA